MTAANLVKFDELHRINDKWTVVRMLGCGSFGVVYKVCDNEGFLYALKTEKYTPKNALKVEVQVLQTAEKQKLKHFLKLFDTGTCKSPDGEQVLYMVMDLAGSSLDALRRLRKDRRFTLPCALTLGIHFIDVIEELHSLGYQHRDIKAANLAVGTVDRTQFYIIDFGLSRSIFDEFGAMRRPRKVAPFRGTVRYAPLACHILRETCRKDDLESWLYSQIEYTRGSLPWRDLNNIIDVCSLTTKYIIH
uniref:Protein kinase domain-containing protein n=1 Tax=Steinernema glaseri TaxID=37863 RepID=A0A1I8A7Z0_9BILA